MDDELGMKLISMFSLCLQHCLHQNSPWSETTFFFTNLVWISWCFWMFADISARDRVGKVKAFGKKKTCFWYTFFSIVQFCVRISASNFQFPSPKAISYNKLILKTENGGFSTFAGVFDPGRGRIRPALLKVRLVFLRDASNDVFAVSSGEEFEIFKRYCRTSFGYMSQFHPKK